MDAPFVSGKINRYKGSYPWPEPFRPTKKRKKAVCPHETTAMKPHKSVRKSLSTNCLLVIRVYKYTRVVEKFVANSLFHSGLRLYHE